MSILPVTLVKAAEAEHPVRGTFGLYSKGKRIVTRRGRVGWADGGWYAKVPISVYGPNGPGHDVKTTEEERIVSMRANWGRKTYNSRKAVRGMWSTREEAEAAALFIVARHPEWLGLLEVRRLVL